MLENMEEIISSEQFHLGGWYIDMTIPSKIDSWENKLRQV